ncbi:MAG: hypothetical protein M3068_06440 [Gemmatimonadota bacterium]|nr:hypothetical protein [Gemmatimonadota bacterium]
MRRDRAILVMTVAIAACAGTIAPPPPQTAPVLSAGVTVLGSPIVIAARASRILQRYAYSTKRFSSDSTWGYRAVDQIAVRIRYASPAQDSTRAYVEIWGKCETKDFCLREEMARLAAGLGSEEPPPSG